MTHWAKIWHIPKLWIQVSDNFIHTGYSFLVNSRLLHCIAGGFHCIIKPSSGRSVAKMQKHIALNSLVCVSQKWDFTNNYVAHTPLSHILLLSSPPSHLPPLSTSSFLLFPLLLPFSSRSFSVFSWFNHISELRAYNSQGSPTSERFSSLKLLAASEIVSLQRERSGFHTNFVLKKVNWMAQAVPFYSQQNNCHVHVMTMPTHLALSHHFFLA